MRIIAGSLKGRLLTDPKSHRTHPMSEKIRGALFNALGDIEGLTLLDAFTGSGAVAIEAVSRGAKEVFAIDNDLDAYKCAAGNVAKLQLQDRITVMRVNAKAWSNNNLDKKFDIVIADAPFDGVNDALLEKIHRHVKDGKLLVLNLPADYFPRRNDFFTEILAKTHGNAKLLFYRKVSP